MLRDAPTPAQARASLLGAGTSAVLGEGSVPCKDLGNLVDGVDPGSQAKLKIIFGP